jgi:hypothetical protein
VLSSGFGAAPAFGGARADEIALHVGEASEHAGYMTKFRPVLSRSLGGAFAANLSRAHGQRNHHGRFACLNTRNGKNLTEKPNLSSPCCLIHSKFSVRIFSHAPLSSLGDNCSFANLASFDSALLRIVIL